MSDLLLEAHHLAYAPQHRFLFTELNLIVKSGEVLQVIGHNGCGKTSLLKLLVGLLPVEHGEVIQWTETPLYIGHKLGIKLGLTVSENLHEIAVLHGAFDALNIMRAIEQFELEAIAHLLCAQLSEGQKRRVALARLLLFNSKLWVLDEPFVHLDQKNSEIVKHCIHQHCQRGGGVIMSSHQLLNISMKQQFVYL